jgi:hypothetical protein
VLVNGTARFTPRNQSKLPNFQSGIAFNVSLPERGIGITLLVKSDRLSMIMLAVNAGVPPLFLVAMTALIVRQMVIA